MPKQKESAREFISRMCEKFKNVFTSDQSVLFCVLCNNQVRAKKISQVTQHLETISHIDALNKKEKNGMSSNQTLLTQFGIGNQTQSKVNTFHNDLCELFVETNIPMSKIDHPSMIHFLKKYVAASAPSGETLRKKYLPLLYENCITKLREKANEKYIWVSLDETTDCSGRAVANFVFGLMNGGDSERGQSYLLEAKALEATNANTIAAFFNDCVQILFPNGKCELTSTFTIDLILKLNARKYFRLV